MKKIMTTLLVLFALCSFVFANGGKEEPATSATTTTTPAKAAPVQAAPEKVVFRVSNSAEPESLDPAKVQGVPEHRLIQGLFEGLVACDPVTADSIPGVAESWTVSDDGLTYTFTLRKNAKWSDGTPITANDVVYSWLRELNPETASPYAWFPAMFLAGGNDYNSGAAGADAVQIKALDDYTFQMTLVGPLPYVIGALEHYSFAIVPQHTIEKYGDQWVLPGNFVGNGPFVLSEWTPQDKIVMTKSETYWDKDNVKLDEVIFYASDDNNTNFNMYLAGDVDWLTTIPADRVQSASMRDDYHVAPQLSTYYYTVQNERAPFNNPNVRKALALAVDRQVMVDEITQEGQIPSWGIVPDMTGYTALEIPFDADPDAMVAEAQRLLAEAGYPNGVGFPSFNLLYNTDDSHKKIAEFVQQQWKTNLGIDCVLENQEWATYLSNRNSGNFDIARAGWVGDYQDPNTFLDMFLTGAGMNGGKYTNAKYDELIAKAATMPAGEERFATLKEAENIFINEDQGIIPFYVYVSSSLIDTDKWGGWYPNTMDYHPVKNIYLK